MMPIKLKHFNRKKYAVDALEKMLIHAEFTSQSICRVCPTKYSNPKLEVEGQTKCSLICGTAFPLLRQYLYYYPIVGGSTVRIDVNSNCPCVHFGSSEKAVSETYKAIARLKKEIEQGV